MTMAERLSAKCLCGAVKFSAVPRDMKMISCHCGMCRHWSGGVFLAVDCGQSLEFEDRSALGHYSSSKWGERLFCKQCGSSLIWKTKDSKYQSVSAQAFEDPGAFELDNQYFIDCKPDNYSFAQRSKTMSEAEVMAAFAPTSAGEKNG